MSAFEMLLSRNRGALERFIRYKVQNQYDAEDLIQETCLAAYQNYGKLVNEEAFKSWILGIANHKCKDYYRKNAGIIHVALEEIPEAKLSVGPRELSEDSCVKEVLFELEKKDSQILYLFYLEERSQEEIARLLKIPLGTVKSRLYYAKRKFRERYSLPPREGESSMKQMPQNMPFYKISRNNKQPFAVKHEELPGMFIIPRVGEKCSFSLYDLPEWKQDGTYQLTVTGNVVIHGVYGVEITSEYQDANGTEKRTIYAQLTDAYCRYLGGSYTDSNGIRHMMTFLDDSFAEVYRIGKDNRGFPVNRTCQGLFTETDSGILADITDDLSDICGRFTVHIAGKAYDTIRILDLEHSAQGMMLCEYYVDRNGHTVLWRRFNQDNWALDRYQRTWTERYPDHDRLLINNEVFVHWYDCVTDYIL